MLNRPDRGEYADFYAAYISKVPDGDLLNFMELQPGEFNGLVNDLTDEQAMQPLAHGKWSVKQVLGHLCDTERIMGYRALRFARSDKAEIEGFEQDDYVRNGPYADLSLAALVEEFKTIRAATLSLLRNLRPEDWARRGTANQKGITVRALAYVIAGHEIHHRNVIEERYLKSDGEGKVLGRAI